MKLYKSFLMICISFLMSIPLISAKEIATSCKYSDANGTNVVYVDLYTDTNGQKEAYINAYNGEKYSVNGDKGKKAMAVYNMGNSQSQCPKRALVQDLGLKQYEIYIANELIEFADANGTILHLDEDFGLASCEYSAVLENGSNINILLEIFDENYSNLYYLNSKNNDYKIMLDKVVEGVGEPFTKKTDSNEIYEAYKANGYRCPNILSTMDGDTTTDTEISIVASPKYDNVTTKIATLLKENYTSNAPERITYKNQCSSSNNKSDVSINGLEFKFNTYSDGGREFCVKLAGMDSYSCERTTTSFSGITIKEVTNTSFGTTKTTIFNISESTVDDFFASNCIGDNYYIYKKDMSVVDSYVLTTSKIEAELGKPVDDLGFDPEKLCKNGNCNIDLDAFCNEAHNARTLQFLGYLFTIAKILVPAVIIIMGVVEMIKVITSGKVDDINKIIKAFSTKLISGVIIFLLPNIVLMIFEFADETFSPEDGNYANCYKCILEPEECQIQKD